MALAFSVTNVLAVLSAPLRWAVTVPLPLGWTVFAAAPIAASHTRAEP
jgi:hypothetical protein